MEKQESLRPLWIGILCMVLGAALIYAVFHFGGGSSSGEQASDAPNSEDEGVVCIQVITPARNPETGEVRDFPTPCDVPEGWDVVR